MVQSLGMCSTLSEGLGSMPITHIRKLKATLQFQVLCSPPVSESTVYVWSTRQVGTHMYTYTKLGGKSHPVGLANIIISY